MKTLVLSGSRNREGKTAQAINAVCKGVSDAGGNTEVLFLTEHELARLPPRVVALYQSHS